MGDAVRITARLWADWIVRKLWWMIDSVAAELDPFSPKRPPR